MPDAREDPAALPAAERLSPESCSSIFFFAPPREGTSVTYAVASSVATSRLLSGFRQPCGQLRRRHGYGPWPFLGLEWVERLGAQAVQDAEQEPIGLRVLAPGVNPLQHKGAMRQASAQGRSVGYADRSPHVIEIDAVVALQVSTELVGVPVPCAGEPNQFFAERALQALNTSVKNSTMSDTLVRPSLPARPPLTFS